VVAISLIVISACREDVFLTDLKDTQGIIRDTSTTELLFKTYQVPPLLGKHTRLFLGKKDNYTVPFSLLRVKRFPFLSKPLIFIDSAYIQITIDTSDSDIIVQTLSLDLGYFDIDSSYSETTTNYTNIDWIPEPESYPLLSSTIMEDTETGMQHVTFSLDTSLIKSWADSLNPEPLFMLRWPEETEPTFITFYSRESESYSPFLKVFYHTESDTVGDSTLVEEDTIDVISDVSLLIPPNINGESFDSTRSYAGSGAGFRTLLLANIDNLDIPITAVILRANLILPVDLSRSNLTSATGMKLRLYSLEGMVENWEWGEVLDEDNYNYLTVPGTWTSETSIQDSTLLLHPKDIIQFLVIGKTIDDEQMENFGFKLLVESSTSIFDYVAFHTAPDGDFSPRLEVLYEVP